MKSFSGGMSSKSKDVKLQNAPHKLTIKAPGKNLLS